MHCTPPGSSIHGILQAKYWSGLPIPPPGDLPYPGIKPTYPVASALAGRLPLSYLGGPTNKKQGLRVGLGKHFYLGVLQGPAQFHLDLITVFLLWISPVGMLTYLNMFVTAMAVFLISFSKSLVRITEKKIGTSPLILPKENLYSQRGSRCTWFCIFSWD